MNIITTSIEGVLVIEPKVFEDSRGFFMETYHRSRYMTFGINRVFVQDNLSYSVRGTVRGLHYQIKNPQAKLAQVISGEVFDVAVDIRPNSPTFGKWTGFHLSDRNRRQLFISEGFAHGFCVVSEVAYFLYKCSDFFAHDDEGGILWSDPGIGIEWPVENPIISEKDKQYPCLAEIGPDELPVV
ncbi:MAG: dTDP-4-dehydrorhamnose 3,5-epimerase [Desulfobacterales bacterium]|jgi:dTDP-4-dehydrorhamnose 3,5-epimerase